ncbi:DUF6894 family protein [Microvirga lotononidis]|uniref:DUF6894 domain-containing protein n=1 Tax=Microvirga lotononidis TaxID=864069 RepID=I4YTE1_9HYPH|nr:hypothetical protein [Microvirga lotononidis]EIM27233.1 hypothetical protein MicloDRAFT_00037910 [Microvirga lotononidis]WQO28592.1 hypothetical protein U0023_05800 [Microvirga lotononidis]
MRYHFHLMGPSGEIFDDMGREAASLERAEADARQAIQEIWDEGAIPGEDWEGWTLQIADASHRVLLTISLDRTWDERGVETLWPAVRNRAATLHGMFLAFGCSFSWPSALALI